MWGNAKPVVEYLERVFDVLDRLKVPVTVEDVQTGVGGNVYLVGDDVYGSDVLVLW